MKARATIGTTMSDSLLRLELIFFLFGALMLKGEKNLSILVSLIIFIWISLVRL
jgi:hypothetical protein